MKKFIILFVLLFFCLGVKSETKRALTVFIGKYPANSGWKNIASSNDKILILNMLHINGFSDKDIICLENEQATHASIIRCLEDLTSSIQRGDIVYIHFSCHGQQITDQDGDESFSGQKEEYDSSLIPFDALPQYGMNGYQGNNHLLDDTLNKYLTRMSDKIGKNGTLIVVLDACHSGDGTRLFEEEDSFHYRGIFDRFEQPRIWGPRAKQANQVNWVALSACTSIQNNYEVCVDGMQYGRLSYAISQCLSPGITTSALIKALNSKYEHMPIPKKRRQTLSYDYPKAYETKVLL